jgi:hypothetical protein
MTELALNPVRVIASGLGSAATAGALAGAAVVGTGALLPVLLLVQVIVALAWVAYTDVPTPRATLAILVAGAVVADVLAVRDAGRGTAATVGVLAASFGAAVGVSLADRHRTRVSEALAVTVTGALLLVFASHLLGAAAGRRGGVLAAVALTSVGVALAVARLLDAAVGGPAAVPQSGRGLAGAVAGVGAAAVVGLVLGGAHAPLSRISGLVLCTAAGVAALVGDLAVELGTHAAVEERSLGAARPLTALVPLCVAAPVVYALARLLVA